MKRLRFLLFPLVEIFAVALAFGLSLLVYYLGEPSEIALGTTLEEFQVLAEEQMRLGHLVYSSEGEIHIFVDGVPYSYHVLTVKERVASFLLGVIRGNFGAMILEKRSVNDALLFCLGPTLIGFGLVLIAAGVSLKLSKKPWPRRALLWVGLPCLGLSHALFFVHIPYIQMGLLFVSLCCLGIPFCKGRKEATLFKVLSLLALGFLNLFLYGLETPSLNYGYEEAFSLSLYNGDNHTSSVLLFFFSLPLLLCFAGGLLSFLLYKKDRKEESAAFPEKVV